MRSETAPDEGSIVHHNSESSLVVEVKSKQHLDLALIELKESVLGKLNESFSLMGDSVLKYKGRLCVPGLDGWKGLKRDIVEFVAKCPNCQQVKVEHQKPGGLLQEIQYVLGSGKTSIWIV